jgi:4-aminobutyrate aminotransferase-like enzyme
MSLKERASKVLSPVLGRYFSDLEVESAKGAVLTDFQGKKYLDFATGIASVSVGHCHPKMVKAIIEQAKKLIHVSAGIAYYESNIALAEKIQTIVPITNAMIFFTQSGGESVEAALKLARFVSKKPGLAAFEGAFHGRSFGALSVTTSKMKYREGYEPLLAETHIIPRNLEKVREIFQNNRIGGIIIEPIMGEGGYIVQDMQLMDGIRRLCNEFGVIMIVDEVQTGFGRTGKWFAVEHFDVVPDVICAAKGIASGMPLGACIAKPELMQAWSPSTHGSTMTGNPVTCAAGLAVIDIIQQENLIENAKKIGEMILVKIRKWMKKYDTIKDARGLGLMVGVEFDSTETVKKIREEALKNGLVLISCGPGDKVIRLVPPLNIKTSQVNAALKIFEKAIMD